MDILLTILWLFLANAAFSPGVVAQPQSVRIAPLNPKIYEVYAGNYRLAADHVVSLGAFYDNGDRLTFYDSKTRRVGVLYDLSEIDFVSGVMRGIEFLAGNIHVTFIK